MCVLLMLLLNSCGLFDISRSLNVDEINKAIAEEHLTVLKIQDVDGRYTVLLYEKDLGAWGKEIVCSVREISLDGSWTSNLSTHSRGDGSKANNPVTIFFVED
jgi:hypothetical protein